MNYPIIDGFLDNTLLKCNMTFLSLAVGQFEALRRAAGYRTKAWVVPEDSQNYVIPARSSYEFQVYMKPGSVIWGYTFLGYGEITLNSPNAGEILRQILSFQVRDSCSDVPLFSEVATKQHSAPRNVQQALSKLLVVGEPGLLHVEITSTFATDQKGIQLILYGGEPVCV